MSIQGRDVEGHLVSRRRRGFGQFRRTAVKAMDDESACCHAVLQKTSCKRRHETCSGKINSVLESNANPEREIPTINPLPIVNSGVNRRSSCRARRCSASSHRNVGRRHRSRNGQGPMQVPSAGMPATMTMSIRRRQLRRAGTLMPVSSVTDVHTRTEYVVLAYGCPQGPKAGFPHRRHSLHPATALKSMPLRGLRTRTTR